MYENPCIACARPAPLGISICSISLSSSLSFPFSPFKSNTSISCSTFIISFVALESVSTIQQFRIAMETVTTDTVNIIEAVKRSANDDAEDAVQANSSKRLKIMVDEDVSGEMAEEVPVVKDVEVSEEVTEVTERVVEAAEDSVAEPAGEAAGEDASEEEDEEFGGAAQQGVIDLSNVSPVVQYVDFSRGPKTRPLLTENMADNGAFF